MRRVQEAAQTGSLRWCREDIDGLREPFPNNDSGEFAEGQEIECGLDPEDVPWTDAEDDDRLSSDDDVERTRASAAVVPVDLPIVATYTPEEVKEATHGAILANHDKILEVPPKPHDKECN